MSDEGPKRADAAFTPIFVRVPVFTDEDLREVDETADHLIAAGNRARSQGRRLKRLIAAARAEFGGAEDTAASEEKLARVTPIATATKRTKS